MAEGSSAGSSSPGWTSRLKGLFQRWASKSSLSASEDVSENAPTTMELEGCAVTATQIAANKDGSLLSPMQHGTNRDCIRMGIVARNCGIIAVADGCALSYWSEIAAHVAAHEFVAYMYHSISNGCSLFDLKRLMTSAVLHVNEKLQSLKHPKTKKPLSVLENGGNTTLIGAVIFPYLGNLDQYSDGGAHASAIPAELQHKPSADDDPFEEKWAIICVGMGDCELHYFKVNKNEAGELVDEEVLANLDSVVQPKQAASPSSSSTVPTVESLAAPLTASSSATKATPLSDPPTENSSNATSQQASPRSPVASGGVDQSEDASTTSTATAASGESRRSKRRSRQSSVGSDSSSKQASTSTESSALVIPPLTTTAAAPASPRAATLAVVAEENEGGDEYGTPEAKPASPRGADEESRDLPLKKSPRGEKDKRERRNSRSPRDGKDKQRSLSLALITDPTITSPTVVSHRKSHRSERRSSKPHRDPTDGNEEARQNSPRSPRDTSQPIASPRDGYATTDDSLPRQHRHQDSREIENPAASKSSRPHHYHRESHHQHGIAAVLEAESHQSQSAPSTPVIVAHSDSHQNRTRSRSRSFADDSPEKKPAEEALSPTSSPASSNIAARKSRKSFRLSFVSPKRDKKSADGASPRGDPQTPAPASGSNEAKKEDAAAPTPDAADLPVEEPPKFTCGKWIKVLGDNGRTPFLPFPGLKTKAIPEPLLMHFRPGDLAMICSDGVMAAFDKATNPHLPPIPKQMFASKDSVQKICRHLMDQIFAAHKKYQTDPDDVALGIFKLSVVPETKRASKPNEFAVVQPEDLTNHYLPAFGNSKAYKRDYLDEWLTDYPKK